MPAVSRTRTRLLWAVLILAAFLLRLVFIYFIGGNLDGDSNGYLILARNLLREHVYSIRSATPFDPTFTRLPGYPLFIALIYSIRADSLIAIRLAQALVDTLTCVAVAALAYRWEPDEKRRRAAAIAAFVLAGVCPFTLRYVPAILKETLSTFLAVMPALAAGRALLSKTRRKALGWWVATGFLCGLAALVRPDAVLLVVAALATLVIAAIYECAARRSDQTRLRKTIPSLTHASLCATTFVLAFTFTLAPWPIRNEVVFHQFILLEPKYQSLPNGFVPAGYYEWLRTWVDDERYVKPLRWELNYSAITVDQIPAKAFDSAEERARVAELLEQYNHPRLDPSTIDSTTRVSMTPEIDLGFAGIATERRGRGPLRFYILLPARRALALWFDTHSDHFPFAGELFPIPDRSYFQNGTHSYAGYATLWLFAILAWLYTLLGLGGTRRLWSSGEFITQTFVLFIALIIITRVAFFSTLDNPEPRYLVQLFPFLSASGGIAIAGLIARRKSRGRVWVSSE